MLHTLSVTLVLFLIMSPLGHISSFLSILGTIEPERRKKVIIRELFFALIAMLVFNFIGEWLFETLFLSQYTVHIASGTILFLVGIKIIFSEFHHVIPEVPEGEPFIVPIAIPLIAGPSLLATVMLYAHTEPRMSVMLVAILIAWLITSAIILGEEKLKSILGDSGLVAIEQLVGMFLILLAIQRFMEGVTMFVVSFN